MVPEVAVEETGPGGRRQLKIGELWAGSDGGGWTAVHRILSGPQPYPPKSDSWARNETSLWVGIAAFRDPRCGRTLYNMYSKASHPGRIMTGIVQQNDPGDVDCMERYCELCKTNNFLQQEGQDSCPFKDQIRIMRLDAAESKGPTYGRHLQYYLLRDQEFCMNTDSHMDYVPDWDVLMMREWAVTDNEYGILSTYVQKVEDLGISINDHFEVAHLCEVIWTSQVRNQQAKALRLMTQPKLTTTWGAGYSFGKCHAERATPADPFLPHVFDGEEFSKFARLWTRGYDVYTPSRSYVGHDYNKKFAPHSGVWRQGQNSHVEFSAATKRLWTLFEMPGGETDPQAKKAVQEGRWGLGKKRTLDQLIQFTGVNTRTKSSIGRPDDKCGTVEFVPFQETWPPEEDQIPDAPMLNKVKAVMKAAGDWTEEDERYLNPRGIPEDAPLGTPEPPPPEPAQTEDRKEQARAQIRERVMEQMAGARDSDAKKVWRHNAEVQANKATGNAKPKQPRMQVEYAIRGLGGLGEDANAFQAQEAPLVLDDLAEEARLLAQAQAQAQGGRGDPAGGASDKQQWGAMEQLDTLLQHPYAPVAEGLLGGSCCCVLLCLRRSRRRKGSRAAKSV